MVEEGAVELLLGSGPLLLSVSNLKAPTNGVPVELGVAGSVSGSANNVPSRLRLGGVPGVRAAAASDPGVPATCTDCPSAELEPLPPLLKEGLLNEIDQLEGNLNEGRRFAVSSVAGGTGGSGSAGAPSSEGVVEVLVFQKNEPRRTGRTVPAALEDAVRPRMKNAESAVSRAMT